MKILLVGVLMMLQEGMTYYQSQFDQVAPLQPTRDVCVAMIPPYIGRRPFRNTAPMNIEVEGQWISHKRICVCASSPFDRYQAFTGMMVQIMKDNLPFGEFEQDEKTEVTDCSPGQKNLALVRSSYKLLTAAVNWVAPSNFDVYTEQLSCIVTIVAMNQKYWTVQFPIIAAPHKYPEYPNITKKETLKQSSA
ncbi:uncharacterized protein LOC128999685 [Macrosteles quadrilineatus]|uniref:uncharacterized protein LOC128999685 n=1 Tax=Macrosteles quadrilineatus TaxID=74068 RepID=UPI0023E1D985|nr:uncharacterized protein LOC128999685 [Macrosteles quadrilineatus]